MNTRASHEPVRIAMIANDHFVTHQLRFAADRYIRRTYPNVRFKWQRTKGLEHTVLNDEPPSLALAHIFDRRVLRHVQSWKCPVVNTSGILSDLPVPSVLPDNVAVGELAAMHLLSKGCENFAYLGNLRQLFSDQRFQGFAGAVSRETGQETLCGERLYKESLDALAERPGHLGVLVEGDAAGVKVYDTLRQLNHPLLDRVAILSSHGFDTPCDPELSSVRINMDFWAARAVDLGMRMLNGEDIASRPHLFAPSGIDERASTARQRVDDPYVQKAVDFIRTKGSEAIQVEDVAGAAGLSRRPLERRFREVLDRTVLQEIHIQRLRKACLLLRETDLPLPAIALEVGFSDEEQLRRLFHKYVGLPPGRFRDDPEIQSPFWGWCSITRCDREWILGAITGNVWGDGSLHSIQGRFCVTGNPAPPRSNVFADIQATRRVVRVAYNPRVKTVDLITGLT